MEELYIKRVSEIKKNKKELEKKLGIKINISGRKIILEGSSFNEYEAALVFEAIDFGFPVGQALILKDENMLLRKIRIRDLTRRKNLKDVRARIIGTHGRTKRTLEGISGCKIVIGESEVGIIGNAESVDKAGIAVTSLIKGSKQANMYKFLERMNRKRKEQSFDAEKF